MGFRKECPECKGYKCRTAKYCKECTWIARRKYG
jgi:hypothetical protein